MRIDDAMDTTNVLNRRGLLDRIAELEAENQVLKSQNCIGANQLKTLETALGEAEIPLITLRHVLYVGNPKVDELLDLALAAIRKARC